jgi:hypothetical protein
MLNSLVRSLRDRVTYLYAQAYPKATERDAERWRMLTIGKPFTEDWTLEDWRKAVDVLMKKIGRRRPAKNQDNRELGL